MMPRIRDKAHRRAGWEQRHDDADQPQWRHVNHQEHLLKALQLNHQDGQHQEDHRENDSDRAQTLGALLDRSGGFDRIAGRQCRLQLGDRPANCALTAGDDDALFAV